MRRLVLNLISVIAVILALSPASIARTDTPFKLKEKQKNPIVWQRFGDGVYMTEDLADGRNCYFFNTILKTSSPLIDQLPLTAAPLGSQIKWLMYVCRDGSLDRLMAGDVDHDISSAPVLSNRNQLGCGMAGTVCVFGQYTDRALGGVYAVDLYTIDLWNGGGVSPFLISDSEKTQFAHDGSLMVYRACYSASDIRIMGIPFSGGDGFVIAARNGYEPSVCGNIVAWYEVNGAGFDIMAKNIDTGEIRTIAYTTVTPPCPEAGRGTVFWRDARNYTATGVDIYGYDWATGQEFAVTTAVGDQLKLRVCDDLVTYCTGVTTNQILWGAYILPPPPGIGDLAVTRVGPTSVTLGWISVGQTGNPPVAYDLRARTDGPITDANWASSAPVSGLPIPAAAGQAESFTVTPLETGAHYFALKVQLQSGDWSALSDLVCAYVSDEETGLTDAPESTCISFSGVVSGIGSGTIFYCQRSDRTRAVMVIPASPQSLTVGQRMTVTGVLTHDDNLNGPVMGDALVALDTGTETVRPLGMRATSLGGFDPRYGGTPEQGPSNLWVRVKVWGKVSSLSTTDGCSFYLSDGSKPADNLGRGIYVTSRFAAPTGIADGAMVSVEGICRLSRTDGRQIEVVESTGITVF